MPEWMAPAKVNLDLRVGSPSATGMHPLRSLVQAIEWADRLTFEEAREDHLEVVGADLEAGPDNLVWRAVRALGLARRPRLRVVVEKAIPTAAGLGGGSADAAATLSALCEMVGVATDLAATAAPEVGADVAFFLTGGTAWMEGHGEVISPLPPLSGFSLGVVVPPFQLATAAVYRRWDELGEPVGEEVAARYLPPALRPFGELRNDLTPAAVSLVAELADWMGELARRWERPVLMSGSGPSLFSFFLDSDEAESALATVEGHRGAVACDPRPRGVERVG